MADPGTRYMAFDVGIKRGGKGVAKLPVTLVKFFECPFAGVAVIAFKKTAVVAVGEKNAFTLFIFDFTEVHIGIVENFKGAA